MECVYHESQLFCWNQLGKFSQWWNYTQAIVSQPDETIVQVLHRFIQLGPNTNKKLNINGLEKIQN